ncbi:Hypothetical predicted protein [Pelobates cultripes]|uniref:Reverse transcriptase domain-containing protein n=1 Tax=Pelobates cultripes TaxID=61616 RepID=A0AAD1RPB0_PELCU|nr:Hypothetical predicted protein [Pelobates cultripes]
MGAQHYTLNFMISLSAAGNKANHRICHSIMITLYKDKEEKSYCSNYPRITLFSVAGKILGRVLLDRVVFTIAEKLFPESQSSFRARRSITNLVFVLRQIQEKCREQNKALYITFIVLTKAFDTVSRKGMWQILECLGCLPKFRNMITQLHKDRYD